jgi:hypothetical protein
MHCQGLCHLDPCFFLFLFLVWKAELEMSREGVAPPELRFPFG